MKRIVAMVALGVGGFVAAIGLTLGALALAGDETGSVVQPHLSPSRDDGVSSSPSVAETDSPTPSPSADDDGGSGSEDSGSGSDDPPGSDDSGSGSDNSGSGSDNSGSGSSNSGSGSDADDD
jgi:hypothetical protein